MMLAVDRERLKRVRGGLPYIGAVHQPRSLRPHRSRRIALGIGSQEDRAADPTLRRRSRSGHEIAVEVDLKGVRVSIDVDLLEGAARLGWEARRRAGRADRATAGGDEQYKQEHE